MSGDAFTLVEVAIGISLISLGLVTILVVRASLLRQSHHASMVAIANVVAGRLVGEWKNGTIPLDVDHEKEGTDQSTGFRWLLNCRQQEVEPGIFLNCLDVRVYADIKDQDPTVSFEAWQPLR